MADSQRKTANLFDYITMSSGVTGYYLKSDGSMQNEGSWNISDYIPCDGLEFTLNAVGGNSPSICLYDENKTFIKGQAYNTGGASVKASVTITSATQAKYIRFSYMKETYPDDLSSIMLNSGSTPLPYEPYGWVHSLRKLTTATDTITTLPSDIYADGNNATVGLVGNMSQTGTPSPTTPIQPSECGERTGNLFDGTLIGSAFSSASFTVYSNLSSDVFKSIKVYLPAGTYTISWEKNVNILRQVIDGVWSQIDNIVNVSEYTFTCTTDDYYGISFRDTTSGTTDWDNTTPIMLNVGSTPLPYQPYGYKLDIKSGNTTTPVYLGEVETTRKIKKLVLTGSESDWGYVGEDATRYFRLVIGNLNENIANVGICTHYTQTAISSSTTNVGFTIINSGSQNKDYLAIRTENAASTSLADFKSYLQQQYAAGTPVCVWYVLATPQTAVVNEPLRKIGDYADSVTATNIPTITGKDTFDVLTTLKPSEVELTYTGWHDASVGEWDGSEWQ